MSEGEKKGRSFLDKLEKISDLLGSIPKAIAGIVLILSLLSGVYGSFFKVETDARETYSVLAPDVELAIEQSDDNAIIIEELSRELAVLKAKSEFQEGLLKGFLTAHGMYKEPEENHIKEEFSPPPEPEPEPVPPQRRAPNIKRRDKQKPYWEKK